MTIARRRWLGLSIAAALLLILAGISVWRIGVVHKRGWAGFSFLPQPERHEKKPRPTPFGWKWGAVLFVFPDSPAERAGIKNGDMVLAVNGVCTCDPKALQRLDDRVHRDDVVVYRIRRDGVERDVPLRFQSQIRSFLLCSTMIVSLLVAIVFITIGSFIFWRRPDDRRVVVFFVMTIVAAVYFLSSGVFALENGGARGIASQQTVGMLPPMIIFGVAWLLFAPLLLHLALIFPRPRPIVDRRPEIFRWIYGPPFVNVAALAWLVAIGLGYHQAHWLGWTIGCAGAALVLVLLARLLWRARREGREAFLRRPIATQIAVSGLVWGLMQWGGVEMKSLVGIFVLIGVVIITFGAAFLTYPIATIIALYRSYRESGVEEKRQVKWPLWATIVVVGVRIFTAALATFIALGVMFQSKPFGMTRTAQLMNVVPRLLYVLIPLSFAFAIVKYRLMNIDLIIRRTVTYALLSAFVFIMYGVLVAGVGTLLVRFAGVQNQAMVIASTIVVALVAVPLRNTLQRVVDRNVFRERVSYPLALRTLADATSGGIGRDDLLRLLAEQLQQALQNRFVLVAMRSDQHFVATAKVGVADEILGTFRVPVAGVDLTQPLDPERDPLPLPLAQRLRRLGATLLVPMRPQREAIGFVALGAKLSNEPFSADDVAFLDAATSQVAMALETSRLRGEEVDFEQARAMQQVLLPKELPRLDGFDIAGMWQPARSVGGDYYDAIALGDGKAAVCIADVAGKGMPAALLMASLQAAVKAMASPDMPPSRLCDKVRHVVAGNLAGGTFITFFYALLDARERTLIYCNAGHNPPLLVRAGGEVERLDVGGSVLGRLFRAESYDEATVALAPGDRIVLFTDGVSEARRADEDFGDERLIDVVRANRELGAEELQEKIVEAITAFTSGSFGDDVTLVVIGAN